MKIKMTLLAVSALFSFSGLVQAEAACATEKCETACATKATKAAKEKCATECATKCATKTVATAAATKECASKKCATKCATKPVATAEAKKCATECAEKCSTEGAKKCAEGCAAECCATAAVTHFNVSGMTCGGCSKDLTAKLSAIEGVTVKKICHKSGCVDVVLSEKATAEQVQAAITAKGFKIVAPAEKKG